MGGINLVKQMKEQLGKTKMDIDFSFFLNSLTHITSSMEFTEAADVTSDQEFSSNQCRRLDQVLHETALLHVVLAVVLSSLPDVSGQKAEPST